MTGRSIASIAVVFLLGSAVATSRAARAAPETIVHTRYLGGIEHFDSTLAALQNAVERTGARPASVEIQARFHEARHAYKHIEILAEYYNPAIAKALNGPAIPEVEEDDPNRVVIPAEGFQVLEEMLFPRVDPGALPQIASEIAILRANLRRLRRVAEATGLTPASVFDAARLEVARIVALGVSGFDSPVALQSLPEAAAALHGVHTALQPFSATLAHADSGLAVDLDRRLTAAVAALGSETDFDRFDRLAFIAGHIQPLLGVLHRSRLALGIELGPERRAWRGDAASIFDANAFDPMFFAPVANEGPASARLVELGRVLFFDPILSGNGQRACASCHRPEFGFADSAARSIAYDRTGTTLRNTPSLLNVGLQAGVFHDLRAAYLEDQVTEVVASPAEMRGSLDHAARSIFSSGAYRQLFQSAYTALDSAAVPLQIRHALAAYMRSLVATSSRFDRYVRGEQGVVLTREEKQGFNLFMGKARCGTCHFAPVFNGTLPPTYTRTDLEVIGVPKRAVQRKATPDADRGAFDVRSNPLHRNAFRTPGLRNVALTAPYMHNGAYRTLEEVVDFYNRGGGAGIGLELHNQTLPPDSLELDEAEQGAVVAFMKTLTDTTTARAAIPQLPEIPGQVRPRIPGGAY